ncbi:MAG TPA: hypothetical protein EYP85_02915 [Armatimonadetes bacterium]|nr:hypothetical protein [Armatimonadota bacterium]
MRNRKGRGVTLVELLVALGLVALVLASVVSIYAFSLRTFQVVRAESVATDEAHFAAMYLRRRLINALEITTAESQRLAFVVPVKDPDTGLFVTPLTAGDEYTVYLSDETGSLAASGPVLWMAVNGIPYRRLAQGVQSLTFAYSPSPENPLTIRLSLTVQGTEGPRSQTRSVWVSVRPPNLNR